MSSSWYNGSGSYFAGGQNNGSNQDGYGGGGQYEATGGKKRGSSRTKKSGGGGKKDAEADADADYPKYATTNNSTKDEGNSDNRYNRNGAYSGDDGGNPYSGGMVIASPYYGGGGYGYGYGGNNSASSYGNGGGSNKKDADADAGADYPKYAANNNGTKDEDNNDRYNRNGNYSGEDYGGNNPYSGGVMIGAPYYVSGGGGGYNYGGINSASDHGNGGGGGGYAPYIPAMSFWGPPPQDGARPPMIITTREVNVYGVPGGAPYDHDNHSNSERRGGGGERGFFGPALQAVGHFIDRRFGLSDRDD